MKGKAIVLTILACVFALALAGCSSGGASSSSASASSSQSKSSSSSQESKASMANPWSDVKTAEEAAKGAGVGTFIVPEGTEIGLGVIDIAVYRYMDGLAEAIDEYPAVEMTIRKGTDAVAKDGDVSGDYNKYQYTWDQDVSGIQVTCHGNRKGDSTNTTWSRDGYYYSITAYGLGGDTDFGLSADDLNTLVGGIE